MKTQTENNFDSALIYYVITIRVKTCYRSSFFRFYFAQTGCRKVLIYFSLNRHFHFEWFIQQVVAICLLTIICRDRTIRRNFSGGQTTPHSEKFLVGTSFKNETNKMVKVDNQPLWLDLKNGQMVDCSF